MTKAERVRALREQLAKFLPVYAPKGLPRVVELRAVGVPGWKSQKPATECGFFELKEAEGRKALFEALSGYVERAPAEQPEGVYLTVNAVDPVFLARANNCMGKRGEVISVDTKFVLGRDWLVIDIDPTRPIAKISATDAEKAEAAKVMGAVRADLKARGFAEPMLCDSGNGYHLWYKIDLPTDDGHLVEHVLKGLADVHDTPGAKIDTKLFDPPRVVKVPGTCARKGADTKERPHRMAVVLEVPAHLQESETGNVQSDAA